MFDPVTQVRPPQNLTELYLQIFAALGGIGGLLALVPKLLKWWDTRRQRKRTEAAEPLLQLRADYERQLTEWRVRYDRKEADHAKDVAKYDRLVEILLRKLQSSSVPPSSSSSTSRPE